MVTVIGTPPSVPSERRWGPAGRPTHADGDGVGSAADTSGVGSAAVGIAASAGRRCQVWISNDHGSQKT